MKKWRCLFVSDVVKLRYMEFEIEVLSLRKKMTHSVALGEEAHSLFTQLRTGGAFDGSPVFPNFPLLYFTATTKFDMALSSDNELTTFDISKLLSSFPLIEGAGLIFFSTLPNNFTRRLSTHHYLRCLCERMQATPTNHKFSSVTCNLH